jgi:hypothetical protein
MDGAIVRALQRRHPTWVLSAANALTTSAWTRTRAGLASKNCDLIMLNPPFSMIRTRGLTIPIGKETMRCSVAMAHVAMALQMSKPRAACAIVPESLMSSELDASVRMHIKREYTWEVLGHLTNSTFQGARANALMISFTRRLSAVSVRTATRRRIDLPFLLRGGLPVHEARRDRHGTPFLHSTDTCRRVSELRRVRPIDRGILFGHAVLIPRVGMPARPLPIVYTSEEVQLSDCVIAIKCTSSAHARRVADAIEFRWSSFESLWRGTGARYVTMSRLQSWCERNVLDLF